MNLYISSDMEGVAGVCAWQQVDARTPHPEYETFRAYYTDEIVSAIAGAREGGARSVLVNDSHGPMRNLQLEKLPVDARVIFGNRKPFSMVQGADDGFDGAFFIGYHGGAGEADAVLCHTYTPSVIYEVRINGVVCSEATINAGLLGYYGVPVVLVSGDRRTVESVRQQMPWVRGAIVKDAIGTFACDSMTPDAAQRLIHREARSAIERLAEAQLYRFDPPIVLDVQLVTAAQAHAVAVIPGFEQTGSRSVRFTHAEFPMVFKAFVATWRLGATA